MRRMQFLVLSPRSSVPITRSWSAAWIPAWRKKVGMVDRSWTRASCDVTTCTWVVVGRNLSSFHCEDYWAVIVEFKSSPGSLPALHVDALRSWSWFWMASMPRCSVRITLLFWIDAHALHGLALSVETNSCTVILLQTEKAVPLDSECEWVRPGMWHWWPVRSSNTQGNHVLLWLKWLWDLGAPPSCVILQADHCIANQVEATEEIKAQPCSETQSPCQWQVY